VTTSKELYTNYFYPVLLSTPFDGNGSDQYSIKQNVWIMGRISKGILGGFSGKVGTVVGGTWKGIEYIRSQPVARKTKFSQKQLEQQAKFKLTVGFLKCMLDLLMVTFNDFAIGMTGYNSAVSYNLKNAITGTYPDYTIDYGLVLVSRGDLPNVAAPVATAVAGGMVQFDWTDNSGTGKTKARDKVFVVVYSPALNMVLYTPGSALRSEGTETLDARTFTGQTVHTYISVTSADGKDIANSVYTGSVVVS
jgi:hypothetical protein